MYCGPGAYCKHRDFAEAIRVTAQAKHQFPHRPDDLYLRGSKLIRESVGCGVTVMRAHVEVDRIVGMASLDVGLRLSEEWKDICDIQIASTSQWPSSFLKPTEVVYSVCT